ncbi:[FeFe] hydrogenase, group A [Patescibacteria group bacterium]|nr:[FeFe] hydrogenase, group A [Patescibacteria group bacterium]MBU4600651.1 [FeFe] hydrogenase, group A [Patescibacteria group bacterium]MCG2698570.1 [FeFe] hydrogenase, group A [Candidatus Parcubacteria bacterium]
MKKIKIKINNQEIECSADKNIYKVAKENGIFIPGLCGHPDFPAKANCRICVVEIKGRKDLTTSCSTKAEDGMEIITDSERVKKARNLNIELIFAEHIEKCPTCVWRVNCALLNFADRYKIEITRFPDRKKSRKIYKFGNSVEIDGTQCIDCRNCIDACSLLQKINYLELKGKGHDQEVVPVKSHRLGGAGKKIDCIYCGQCAVHCPVGSAQEQTHWEMVENALNNKNKIVVAQFAPSIRVSIGEEFNIPYGKTVTGQVISGLRKLGFKHVFDVNFAADITTMVEAQELLERLLSEKNPKSEIRNPKSEMPMFTSCCPAWVKYVEFYHPELIPNLTTSRSPQIHLGGIIKTFWAEKMNINPKNIVVVSVMPCTAKKFESSRKEMKIKGVWPVDYVITTREFAWMLKKNNIDFAKLKSGKPDNLLGEYSGAAAIYGGSGGVMESALRTAQFLACGKSKSKLCEVRLDFKDVRGMAGIKETIVNVAGKNVRVAVVNGIGNIDPILRHLDKYDYIEVMACPGGCIGGGGQPIPTTPETRKKRIEALYRIDKNKKIRKAHENKCAAEALGWLKKQGKLECQVLHTKYKKRS